MRECITHHCCECKQAEIERLREALEFAVMTIGHAIHLGYVGEGSTLGMFNDACKRARKALERGK